MSQSRMITDESAEPNKPQPLSRIFGLGKREVDAIEVLGFHLYEQGRNIEAHAIFEGLIALDDRLYHGYAGLGAMALAEQKLDEAATWLSQALERNGNDPTVHANLGETLLRLGRFESAASEFERALKLDPERKDPGANRARAILSGMRTVIDELQKQKK